MRTFLTLSLVASLLTTVGLAEDKKTDKSKKNAAEYVPSTKMIGSYIYSAKNKEESVADINTIVLDAEGNPHFVIAGVGGVAGVGETEVAIPYKALSCECKMKDGEKVCHASVPMTKDQLSNAPAIDSEDYDELTDKSWLETNAKFYSAEAPKKALKAAQLICVATVTDMDITGSNDESVGHLDAVIFDVSSHKAKYGIIGDGGTVGINEKYVAVPFTALQFKMNEDGERTISINATPESIKKAPAVTPSEYPELDLESVRDRIGTSVASND